MTRNRSYLDTHGHWSKVLACIKGAITSCTLATFAKSLTLPLNHE